MSRMMKKTDEELRVYALEIAALSPALKRKVGAVISDKEKGQVYATGHNRTYDDSPCEIDGKTSVKVIHAEIDAINEFESKNNLGLFHDELDLNYQNLVMYVTHKPCDTCTNAIHNYGIPKIIVVDNFMKFDDKKLRYELIPPKVLTALASVFTFGARAYKDQNWQKVDNPSRYIGAAYRHFESYRAGEIYDEASGYPHLWHLITNIGFLIHLDFNPIDFLEGDGKRD